MASARNEEIEIAVIDLETDPFKVGRTEIEPFLAGFYDGKILLVWWGADCVEKLIAYLKTRKKRILVYAHNGGNFDFHFLLEFLPVDDCEFLCQGKRIVRIKTPWAVEFRDSFAIIPKKLAAYGKKKIDYAKFERPVRERWKRQIIDYLKSDLRNNWNMVKGFWKRFPGEATLASSVFKLMKSEFGYNPGRSTENYDRKFRPFFFGGRVQFWRLGFIPGRYKVVDINSAYPWAMTNPHWFGFGGKCVAGIPPVHAEQSLYMVDCFARGCFPMRQPNGSIEFPHCRGRFYVTGWELLTAMEFKLVSDLKILTAYVPDEVKDIASFSNTLYGKKLQAKKDGDKEEEFFYKIAVNAGYGKLALNPMKFSEVKVTTIYDRPKRKKGEPPWQNCWDDKERGLSFWKRPSYREGIDKFVNVATAASITGCVRAFLLRSIMLCGGALYCDTDSLIVRNPRRLKFGDKLGEWKIELSVDSGRVGTIDHKRQRSGLWIGGKKLYAAFGTEPGGKWKWKKASKGVNLPPAKIIEVAKGREQIMTFVAPTYSLFSPPRFVVRKINRADNRK